MNSEAALVAVLDDVGRTFDKLGDEYFRQRKDDIVDVGKHVMRNLLGTRPFLSRRSRTGWRSSRMIWRRPIRCLCARI